MSLKKEQALALVRISLGLIFLWAFIDKLFGLGFTTAADKSWLLGNSPTYGFLAKGVHGPFASVFNAMAGSALVDWLFMIGLLCIGIALILGIGMRIATYSGALLMVLMWLATLPPEHHPFLDEHVIYALTLIALMKVNAGQTWGFGKQWSRAKLVKRNPWME